MIHKLPIILFLFCLQIDVVAQQTGMPYITNYPPEVYKANSQNWAIVQDKRGVMFFGNSNGIMEYDGIAWRFIPMQNTVRSLAIDSAGCIFVGGNGDFGYLHPDSVGTYQYQSLKEKIPLQHLEFNDVWNIFVSGKRVYFQTFEKIFIYQNGKFTVLYPEKSFHLSFLVNHSLYVREVGKGLMICKNDSLQLIEGGERFADEKIYAMLPFRQNEILIVTRTQGILIYSPEKNKHFYKPAGFEAVDKIVIQNMSYCGDILSSGCFALGTLAGGIIVFNSEGKIQTICNTGSGLQDNSIRKLYTDNNQQLWAALNNGISLVQTNLPFQLFTEINGLKGFPMCISFFNNRLYVGTSQYLCVQNPDGHFETIAGTEGQNWQLYKANETLLLADINGLFEIKEKQAIPLITNYGFINLCPINNKPGYLLAGLESGNGISLLEYSQKTWKMKNTIKGFSKYSYTVVQDKEGFIWVHTNPGLYRLQLNQNMDSAISVIQYTTEHGLPPDYAVPCLLNSGELVFVTTKGIYRYNSSTEEFKNHPAFNMLTGSIYPFQQQKNGDIWFQEVMGNGIYEKGVLKYNKGKYQLYKQAFHKFNDYLIGADYNFYSASDSAMFIGTIKGLLQYNPLQKADYNIPFHTLIRKVLAKDSLLFGGTTANTNEFEHIKGVVLPYRQNNLVFHYAAAFYEDVENNLYSYRLLGLDTSWSAWVSDVKKEYTNLREGRYTFEVKSKNQYKVTGKTAKYSFRILPPWQRTLWAYSLYFILFITFIYFIIKLYTHRLVAQKVHLEQVVKERTAEVVQQKEEIQSQAEELKTTNEKLVELDHFKEGMTGMIVHDLKNPLNAILGVANNEDTKQAARQMLNLVLNILDVQKIEDAKLNIQWKDFSLNSCLFEALQQVKLLYERKSIVINNLISKNVTLKGDVEIIERIFINLLTNAIKYTPNNGTILIDNGPLTMKDENESANLNSQFSLIRISDTGPGIPADKISSVFDKFVQVEAKNSGRVHSTGLGLTFCKLAVEAHGGKIGVESEIDKGSAFWVTIPKSEKEIENNLHISTINKRPEKLVFTNQEKQYLEPFMKLLTQFSVYEFSDIRNTVQKIDSQNNPKIEALKNAIIDAMKACNEERFIGLLDL